MENASFPRLTNQSNFTGGSIDTPSVAALVSVVAMGCTMAFAIFGNILVMLAVRRTKSLRTTAAILVVNLAIVDLSITVTVVPFVMTLAVTQEWVLPWAICELTGFINAFLTAGQIMALLHISVNRYIAVAYPHSYESRCNKRGTIITVLLGWFYCLVWTLLPFCGWGKLGFIHGTLFCNILWSEEMAYAITVQVMCYFIPSILGAILYLSVYKHVRLQSKRIFEKTLSLELAQSAGKNRTESSHSINDVGAPKGIRTVSFNNLATSRDDIGEAGFTTFTDLRNTSSATARAKRGRRRKLMETRVTKMLLAVVMAFVFCWIPRGIANLWAIFVNREAVPRALEYSSTVFVFFNAALNPVLYGALHQDFQRAFRRIICCEPA
ncbi:hypothetical protein OS493_038309 [Desmophyllum pertusum]|uniref:G-protein coupled receptors family 1 profile domain-containing protein n=1 Tax=Desmophyllum pertusum TaxID=174260 RepID=A0A9W9YU82_9CNID|nr:hypothetical protein OS493_038309 [Desmophyllum pertusum]